MQIELGKNVDHRCSATHQRGIPVLNAGEYHDYSNVENRADNQRRDDPERDIPLRILGFLGCRRDGVKPNESEEYDRSTR